jgi:hypothetical protein
VRVRSSVRSSGGISSSSMDGVNRTILSRFWVVKMRWVGLNWKDVQDDVRRRLFTKGERSRLLA